MTTMSASAVLRVAGLPVRLWLAAAAPALFACLRELNRAEDAYRDAASDLAERLGAELVPSPELPAAARGAVLSARRLLHRGRHLPGERGHRLREIAAAAGPGLTAQLNRVTSLSADVLRLEERAGAALERELDRLLTAPWPLLHAVPGGWSCADPGVLADIERRLAAGEPWTTKRMRRRSDYLWRMIARGGVKTTPRTWLGQVSLVPVAESPAGLSMNGQVAVEWTENVHARRRDLARSAADGLHPDHRLSLAPLHRVEGDRLAVWTVDPASSGHRLVIYRLRRTPALETITAALGTGARPVSEIEPGSPPGLLAKLVQLGVLEVSAPLRRRPARWRPTAERPGHGGDAGFVDVYRRADGAFTADLATLRQAFEQYRRISLLIDEDAGRPHSRLRERIGPRPRPVMDVFAEEMAARAADGELSTRTRPQRAWPAPRHPGSGYARLLHLLDAARYGAGGNPAIPDAARTRYGAGGNPAMPDGARTPVCVGGNPAMLDGAWTPEAVDITPAMLDAVDAPDGAITWPVDLVVRPLPAGGWVLDNTGPAGILDARFVETLRGLYGAVPAADAYRDFLGELDRISGVPSVELLVPPLAEMAANAIRRPRYTSVWTGDPEPRHYGPAWRAGAARHLPLGELTAHREAGRVVISYDGRPVRICTHATRNALAPWTVLTAILCADSQQHAAQCRRLRRSLTAFPGRSFVPRITVAGSLVVSVAQWRVAADQLDLTGGDLVGLRALTRLADRLGLPRWVFVAGPTGDRPLACDLSSVRAVRVFEQALRALPPGDAELTVAEMLPAPGDLSVSDHGTERVAAEVLVRLAPGVPPAAAARGT